jgi:hypothetical protein
VIGHKYVVNIYHRSIHYTRRSGFCSGNSLFIINPKIKSHYQLSSWAKKSMPILFVRKVKILTLVNKTGKGAALESPDSYRDRGRGCALRGPEGCHPLVAFVFGKDVILEIPSG